MNTTLKTRVGQRRDWASLGGSFHFKDTQAKPCYCPVGRVPIIKSGGSLVPFWPLQPGIWPLSCSGGTSSAGPPGGAYIHKGASKVLTVLFWGILARLRPTKGGVSGSQGPKENQTWSAVIVALLQPVGTVEDAVLTSCTVAIPGTRGGCRVLSAPEFTPSAAFEVCLLFNSAHLL